MSIGIQTSKQDVDNKLGTMARELNSLLTRAALFKAWLDAKTVEDLMGMGWSEDEANVLKSAVADMDALRRVAIGETATAEHDFMVFCRRIYGFGM